MPPYQSNQSILIASSSESLSTAFQTFCTGSNNKIAKINLDGLLSTNLIEAQTGIQDAFDSLGNKVNILIIDTRSQMPSGQDAIWEVPLSEWDRAESPMSSLQKMLLPAKLFLQNQVKAGNEGSSDQLTADGFSIVILGYHDNYGPSLKHVVSKLQRDVARLHPSACVNFLNLDSSFDASDHSIAAATAVLVPLKVSREILSLSEIPTLHHTEKVNNHISGPRESRFALRPLQVKRPKAKIALSFDFDAVSAFLGTGHHPDNNLADYSTGIFSGRVGARRILHMLHKHQVADKVTWFIPGHTMETFEETVKEIISSGAEIGLHGYSHEGAYQMTPTQERDVLVKCIEVSQRLTGKRVRGYRAPMYQLRETTIELLREFEFLYDSSLSHHDSQPYFTPSDPPIEAVDFSQPASTWLRPTSLAAANARPAGHPLVEIPTGWNNEDMMALQYFPHLDNSHGHVDVRVVEQRWKDMFLWLWDNAEVDGGDGSFIFPILMHPDTSGMAHVIGMVDRFVGWLRGWGDTVQFHTFSSISQDWLDEKGVVS